MAKRGICTSSVMLAATFGGSLLSGSGVVSAAITPTYNVSDSTTAFDGDITTAATPGSGGSSDLILNGSPTLASATNPGSTLSPPFTGTGFYDGSAASNANYSYFAKSDKTGPNLPVDYFFTLNTAASPTGCDITKIQSVAGWTDSNLAEQEFTVFVKTVANPTFTSLGTFKNLYGTALGSDNNANSTETILTDPTGTIATGVTAIQFHLFGDDLANQNPQSSGGTLYRDVAVIGAPTPAADVPEPATLGLFGLAGGLMFRRRRA